MPDPHMGVAISAADGSQVEPKIVSDSAGGAIITWMDRRNGPNYDIYAQRIDGGGIVQWTANGVPVSKRSNYQWFPKLVSDDAGGAIIVWEDDPNDATVTDLYAQRVDSAGVAQWTADGFAISTAAGAQRLEVVVKDGYGGAIIVWYSRSGSGYDIYAQKVNNAGSTMWQTDGVPIASSANDPSFPQAVADGAGGAIIVWNDSRSGSSAVYGQRVNSAGVVQWAPNGIPISAAAGAQVGPHIVPDGSGGAIIVWQESASRDFYAQRVDRAGVPQWVPTGVVISMPPGESKFGLHKWGITSNLAGGMIIVWENSTHIWGQSVDSAGSLLWSAGKNLGTKARLPNNYHSVVSDGIGGAFLVWHDELPCCGWLFQGDIGTFARRVSNAGDIQWSLVARYPDQRWDQTRPQLIPDGIGGAIIVWQTEFVTRLPGPDIVKRHTDVYAQHVSAGGMLEW